MMGAGKATVLSVIVGTLIAVIPQRVFGWWAFRARGARSAKMIVNNLFAGEAIKIVLTAACFVATWSTMDWIVANALIGGFIVAIVVGSFSPLVAGIRN